MLETLKAYYDGTQVVLNEENKRRIPKGELVLTYTVTENETDSKAERWKRYLESEEGVIPTGRTAEEIDSYIRSLRDNDRL